MLASYEKKWFTYYSSQTRSPEKVCVNEDLLFEKIDKIILGADCSNQSAIDAEKSLILDLLEKKRHNIELNSRK